MHTGFGLRHFWESVTQPVLEHIDAKIIVEVGCGSGKSTHDLVQYAQEVDGFIQTIDPTPPHYIHTLQKNYSHHLRVFEGKSLEVLPKILQCDAVLIDGDHNWYTVYNELLIIDQIANRQGKYPLVILHDTGWPYGRRDQYCDPSSIPAQYRHGYARKGIYPEQDTLSDRGGFNDTFCHAMHEGGTRNGVATAIEDALRTLNRSIDICELQGGHGLTLLIPPDLQRTYPTLRSLIQSFSTTELVERRRIFAEIESQTHWRSWQMSQKELAEVRASRTHEARLAPQLRQTIQSLEGHIDHITQTRSWRMTAPFRHISRLPYLFFGALKDLWTDFGEPAPQLVRYVRHVLLGKLFPITRDVQHITPATPKTSYEIAVLITSHNYGQYIEEAIQSVLEQTLRPKDIIVVDDASNDETANIAAKYADQGVRYLRGEWQQVGHARNAGMQYTPAPFLLCLDADDTIDEQYLESAIRALRKNPDAGVAYGNIRIFGEEEQEILTPEVFDEKLFDQKNTLPTPCVFRRDAVLQAGGWSEGSQHHGDWVTWRRVLALGWKAVKCDAFFYYRKHKDSMHAPLVERQDYATRSGLAGEQATLFIALSGREWMWEKTANFLERQTFPHDRIHLIILDTSQNPLFGTRVRKWLMQSDYGKQTYIADAIAKRGIADVPREVASSKVALACATIYNKFGRNCLTPIAFVLEDDIIPPDDVFQKLVGHFEPSVISVSAAYRHREREVPVAWEWNDKHLPVDAEVGTGITAIGGTGFGCIALRGAYVKTTVFTSGPPLRNYDQNFFYRYVVQEGMQAFIDWDLRCKHYRSTDDYVEL